jgi:putative CocE/NonD family hydrolase
VQFNSKTAVFYREEIEFPFFNFWLKGKGDGKLPEAYVFETGTNLWRKEESWPPKDAQPKALYFQAGGRLSFDVPKEGGAAFDEYISDPNKPVPFISGQAPGMTREHMVEDQRFASTRTDVLTYQTDVLDSDVTLAGPITASLFVSTTGTDADWVVKLIDVYPDEVPSQPEMGGYQLGIAMDIFRGRYRESFETAEAIPSNTPVPFTFALPTANHVFLPGHRIMVQVQSTWFPLYDRNPQTFVPNIFLAKASDYQKAVVRIYHSGQAGSFVALPVVAVK